MREEFDEQDPKSPRPVEIPKKKGTNPLEAREGSPWRHLRKDDERDRHRHV
jgi:hypothetical protein